MDTLEKNIRIKFMRLTDSAPTWAEFNTEDNLLVVEEMAYLLGLDADLNGRGDELDCWLGGDDFDIQIFSIPELDRTIVSFYSVNHTASGYGVTYTRTELIPTIRIKTSALKPLRAIRGMDQHGVPLTFEHLFRAPRS